MNELIRSEGLVIEQEGRRWTTSLIVAKEFDKDHWYVMEAIDELLLKRTEARPLFRASEYKDATGRTNRMHLLNKDGFALLAFGFTGDKALDVKFAFLNAFNAMIEEITRPKSALDLLAISLQVSQEHERRLTSVETRVLEVEAATEAKIKAIETKLIVDKVNQFPEGCMKLKQIADEYFPGMSTAQVSRWLRIAGHDVVEYKYTDAEGKMHMVAVYKREGLDHVVSRLVRESEHKKDTNKNSIYDNPQIGCFYVKRVSHVKSFMHNSFESVQ